MNKYLAHLKTICRHKSFVMHEMYMCGHTIQGLLHDLTKFLPVEFFSSAHYFQGDKSPIEAEKAELGYSRAWLYHKGHNPHHWEYWVDFNSKGEAVPAKIPFRYVIEMVCDFIGAGKAYGEDKWTEAEPYDYFLKALSGRHYHPDTLIVLYRLLSAIKDKGCHEFYKMARGEAPYQLLELEYKEGLLK